MHVKQGHKIIISAAVLIALLIIHVRLVKMPLHCASHSRSRVISTSETLSGNGNWLAVVTNLQGSKCNIETVDGQYVLLTWVTCAAKQVGKNRV